LKVLLLVGREAAPPIRSIIVHFQRFSWIRFTHLERQLFFGFAERDYSEERGAPNFYWVGGAQNSLSI